MEASSRRIVRRRAVLVAATALALASATAVRAATLDGADERAVGAVVREQLDALASDDAARAYAFATPAIRALFRDPQTFLAMVKGGYAAIVRPRSAIFFKPEAVEADEAELRVQIVDRVGAAWIAVYRLERQQDRSWRIAGCTLAPSRGQIA